MKKKYTVDLENHTIRGKEHLERLEFERESFTKREFKIILAQIFHTAALSNQYALLTAKVRCGADYLFTVWGNTETDGSTIRTHVSVTRPMERPGYIRTMVIAE